MPPLKDFKILSDFRSTPSDFILLSLEKLIRDESVIFLFKVWGSSYFSLTSFVSSFTNFHWTYRCWNALKGQKTCSLLSGTFWCLACRHKFSINYPKWCLKCCCMLWIHKSSSSSPLTGIVSDKYLPHMLILNTNTARHSNKSSKVQCSCHPFSF